MLGGGGGERERERDRDRERETERERDRERERQTDRQTDRQSRYLSILDRKQHTAGKLPGRTTTSYLYSANKVHPTCHARTKDAE